MVGIAALGLETLRQSNVRTEKLLEDQERIAFFNETYYFASNLVSLSIAIEIEPSPEDKLIDSVFANPGATLLGTANNLLLHTGHGLRALGQSGMPDAEIIAVFRKEAERLDAIARRAASARQAKNYGATRLIVRQEFTPIAASLQGRAYSRIQQIEAEMSATARSTALAYERSRKMVATWASLAVGLSLFLGYAISSSLVWPVERIGQALKAIAKGEFYTVVKVPNRDELGILAENVNITSERLGDLYRKVESQRAELEAEHARSESLLNDLLPQQIAVRLKSNPKMEIADHIPLVAILFADIVNFTPRAAKMEPREIVSFLNRVFSTFDVLTEKYGLEKIKTIGDAYMVTAGVPYACEKPVHRLATMALAMIDVTKQLPGDVEIRVGLHAGPVVAGVIGNQKPFYDVWGDTVNTASRMESHGEAGRIQVTEEVKKLLVNEFDFKFRGLVNVAGIGTLNTWWLTGKRATLNSSPS